jgi:hypothetical protein
VLGPCAEQDEAHQPANQRSPPMCRRAICQSYLLLKIINGHGTERAERRLNLLLFIVRGKVNGIGKHLYQK